MNKALQILIDRGFVKDFTDAEGLSKLMDEGPVTFYCGTDPTAKSLHIGHIVPFFAMHHLQKEGHNPIILVGGGTALIGDPSGKTEMRPILSKEVIRANADNITRQLSRIVSIDTVKPGYGKAVIANNASWLTDLNYIDFLRDIGRYFSVNPLSSSITSFCSPMTFISSTGIMAAVYRLAELTSGETLLLESIFLTGWMLQKDMDLPST